MIDYYYRAVRLSLELLITRALKPKRIKRLILYIKNSIKWHSAKLYTFRTFNVSYLPTLSVDLTAVEMQPNNFFATDFILQLESVPGLVYKISHTGWKLDTNYGPSIIVTKDVSDLIFTWFNKTYASLSLGEFLEKGLNYE